MIEIGRLCIKTAGRDSGKKAVIIDILDDTYVIVGGQTRRKKCNIRHLELLDSVLKVGKNSSREEIAEEMKKAGINVKEKKQKAAKKENAAKPSKTKTIAKKEQKEAKMTKPAKKKG